MIIDLLSFRLTPIVITLYALLKAGSPSLVIQPGFIAAWWPPSGLLLALFLLSDKRQWLRFALLLAPVDIGVDLLLGRPVPLSLIRLFTNILGAVAGAWLVQRFAGGAGAFRTMRSTGLFCLLAVGIVPGFTTIIGAAGTVLLAPAADFFEVYRLWFLAIGLGILHITPTVVIGVSDVDWKTPRRSLIGTCSGFELAAFLSALMVVVLILSTGTPYGITTLFFQPYLVFPVLFWAAIRFETHGATLVALSLAVVAIRSTALGSGPFVQPGLETTDQLLSLQAFLGIAFLSALSMAVLARRNRLQIADMNALHNRYRSLVTATTSVVWVTGPDGGFHERQPSWESFTGQPWPDHRGYGWVKMIHPDDRDHISNIWKKALETRTMVDSGGRMWQERSGSYRFFTVRAAPVLDTDGTLKEWIGTITDITGQKLAERELKESEQRLRATLATTSEGYWRIDPVSKKTREVNQALCHMLEVDEEEMIGRTPFDFVDEKNKPIFLQQTGRIHSTRQRNYEITLRAKSGREVHTLFNAATLRNSHGESLAAFAFVTDITRQREQQQFLESTIESLSGIFYLFDREGRLERWNENFQTIAGYSAEEMHHKYVLDFIPEDERTMIQARVQEVFATGRATTEAHLLGNDGKKTPFFFTGTRVEIGGKLYLTGTGVDITSIKETRALLRKTESRFRRVFQSNMLAIAFWHRDGAITDANDAFLDMLGHERVEMETGRIDWRKLTPEEYLEKDERVIEGMIATGVAEPYEKEYVKKSGDRLPILIGGALLEGEENSGVLFALDISEIKRAKREAERLLLEKERVQQRLLETLELNQKVHEAANVGLLAYQADSGDCVMANPAAAIVGGTREQILSQNFRRIDSWKNSGLFDLAETVLSSGRERTKDVHIITTFGREVWLNACFTAFTSQGQQHLLAIFDDITERKQVEEILREARNAAHQANQAKSTFLSMMSHEIRTPLNAILGMGELLSETDLSETQNRCLTTLNRSGEALLSLINDILDLSRIEEGRLQLEPRPFDLLPFITETIDIFSFSAHDRGIDLQYRIDAGSPAAIRADPVRLRQVLINLLGNAIKFTSSGGVTLDVRHQPTAGKMIFSVADTGPGIPEEKRETIFHPFTQIDASTTRKQGGSGLGLTICRRIVELMAGEIHLDSQPGLGSTFTVTIPYQTPPMNDELEKTAPAATVTHPHPPGEASRTMGNLKVLLVDDSEENRLVVEAFLQKTPCRVVSAIHGRAALELFEKEAFDLVLLDIQMPVMDGYETIRHLRRIQERRSNRPIPIIALTAHATTEDGKKIRAAGFDRHLTKPIRKKRLLQTIQDIHSLAATDPGH